ncbi:Lrp/AsnC ligand binding domain-containing protein [Chelativorans salis]|uniref:Lrp/AsnC ligand binding domain-containing protein n=1 Tax=Chelativorans salis TaxID=2978478 RepID=A0ABT2LII6_9HYPH|nr:Lrp/AsnC ligand binding domain-containing protein [Chelativorans sp. EGI FJ00035]MCT7374380.1 Lrp/AsnC ligand binding domain-containing protein [Chelativorans sp. EGI FJ00035]
MLDTARPSLAGFAECSGRAIALEMFRRTVTAILNVIDFYQTAGDYDYMLRVMTEDMTLSTASIGRSLKRSSSTP